MIATCQACGQDKPHAVRSDCPGKPASRCKDCASAYGKAWREKNWKRRKAYDTWSGMVSRCHNPNQGVGCKPGIPKYADYGAKGVSASPRWRTPDGFKTFLKDVGFPPTKEATLDRINPHRNYTKTNVRWADPALQAANRKNTRWITANGLTLSLSEWGRRSGINRHTIAARLNRGWLPDRAVSQPVAMAVPF